MDFSASRIITIGSLKMTMPAFVTCITAILLGAFLTFKGQPVVGLGLMFGMFVNAYTVNCTVVGHCNSWAWTLAVVYALTSGLLIGGKSFMKK